MTRRILSILMTLLCASAALVAGAAEPTLDLGARRELFVDDYLIATIDGLELTTNRPERKEIAMEFDRPWELGNEGYATIMKVDGGFRAYYRAWGIGDGVPMRYCVAESVDGLHWTRPALNLCAFKGVTENNNIMLDAIPGTKLGTHDFTPFVDERPGCPAEERYKAIGFGFGAEDGTEQFGVYAWKSADGLRWTLMQETPVYSQGKFDTQNIAFWSTVEGKYVLYYREFVGETRVVVRATSEDFLHWTREGEIRFPNGGGPNAREQFYTNQIQQYYRAPNLYIGTPTRYVDNGMTASTPLLPEWQDRQRRMGVYKGGDRLGTATTDIVFMASRDGLNFRQGSDVMIAPGLRTSSNWFYGDNYAAWNIVETPSAEDDSPNELSIFVMESTNSLKPSRLRRYALRIDGFGSLHARSREGVVETKPLTFEGAELSLNVATSSAGYVKVEVLDEDGTVVPGYSADDCDLIYGDAIDRRATWKGNADMSQLAGRPIRLRITMYEADLYSLKWER